MEDRILLADLEAFLGEVFKKSEGGDIGEFGDSSLIVDSPERDIVFEFQFSVATFDFFTATLIMELSFISLLHCVFPQIQMDS